MKSLLAQVASLGEAVLKISYTNQSEVLLGVI